MLGRPILHYYFKGVKQIKSNNKVNKQIIVNFSQYNTRKRVFKIKNKKKAERNEQHYYRGIIIRIHNCLDLQWKSVIQR